MNVRKRINLRTFLREVFNMEEKKLCYRYELQCKMYRWGFWVFFFTNICFMIIIIMIVGK